MGKAFWKSSADVHCGRGQDLSGLAVPPRGRMPV